jgi:hypothetical protein
LAKINENGRLCRVASCIVSFTDLDGLRHGVEVEAESLYEAAVKAIVVFRKFDHEPGAMTKLEIEVRTSIVHTLTTKKVFEWLKQGCNTPKEAVMKERLRELL